MTAKLAIPTEAPFNRWLETLGNEIRLDLSTLTAKIGKTVICAGSFIELRAQLSAAIYTHFHIGNPDIENIPVSLHQDLAAELISRIPHRSVLQSATALHLAPVMVQGLPRQVVSVGGVKVLFPLQDVDQHPERNTATVCVPSWRTRTTPGFLLALGGQLKVNEGPTARLYIACNSAAEALKLWPAVIRELSARKLSYQIKALSSSLAYPRSDAIVIYLAQNSVSDLAYSLAPLVRDLAAPKIPPSVFAHHISPRLSVAVEPKDLRPSHQGLSFGQHRSRVLADALLRSSREGMSLRESWIHESSAALINPVQPGEHLNTKTLHP